MTIFQTIQSAAIAIESSVALLNRLKDRHASLLIKQSGKKQDEALNSGDYQRFFKYHAISLRLIEYRIKLATR